MRPIVLVLLCLSAMASEIELSNGTKVPYEELTVSIESPKQAVTVKSAGAINVYRISEVKIASLPPAERERIDKVMGERKAQRMFIIDDAWTNCNEMLLRKDPRFRAKEKLHRVGASAIEVKNQIDGVVTLGIRCGDKGYEMSLAALKSRNFQVPDGKLSVYMAFESEDGKDLVIQKSPDYELNHTRLTLTIVKGDKPGDTLGTIPIPEEYQVR